ncbi:MAG: MMPL family transporter [Bacteroidales bacterium]|nr:MMPL family transporter [Bacteroidales bacterium]
MEKGLLKLLKTPWLVLGITLLISAIFFLQMKEKSRMETDLDEYMPQKHPAFVYSTMAEEWFNIKDGIIFALENEQGIYNTETLDTLKQLTKRLQKLQQINKSDVNSLYTADNIVGTEDGLDVKAFFTRVPKTEEELSHLQEIVRSNEMVFGRLVSESETVTLIVAELEDGVFSQEFYDEILALAASYQTDNIKIHVVGRPIVEGTLALLAPADMKKMIPIVLLVIILVLFLALRNIKNTLLVMLVVLISTIWAFGLMAIIGIPIYAVSTMLPVMLIATGVAYGVHLYSHLEGYIRQHPETTKLEAVSDMLKVMSTPVIITAVTTAVGFVSLLTSQVYPVKYFGLFTGFGVLSAMLLSLVFIPAGIMAFGLPKFKPSNSTSKIANTITAAILKYKSASIVGTIVIIALMILGTQKLWINSSFLDKFEKDSAIVKTDEFINSHFGGTTALNLILDANDKVNTFKQPDVLRLIDKMQATLEEDVPEVGTSFALTNFLKRMNKVMHGDRDEFDIIPDNQNLVAQYLLLYEMSGDPKNLVKAVNYNYSRLNVTIQLKSDDSKAINSAIEVVHNFEDEFKDLGISINFAGSGYKGLVFSDLILEGQIWSLILSVLIVIVLLAAMFRNIMVGLISAVPILVTALIGFGAMGFLNIPLNATTALLSSIAVGIGIDYAVHFIYQYRRYAQKTSTRLEAAQKTMAHAGRAISYNAIVVILGFLVLIFSVFPPNRELGSIVSLNMFTSFVGTLSIMLVLLYYSKVYFKNRD